MLDATRHAAHDQLDSGRGRRTDERERATLGLWDMLSGTETENVLCVVRHVCCVL